MQRKMIGAFIGMVCCFLTACSTFGPVIPAANQSMSVQKRSAQVSQIQSWAINGSVSIQHDGRTDLAKLDWKQQGQRYDITLYGPLSLGYVGIAGQPGSVTFTRTNQRAITATSPEALMQQQLGWQMPVSALYYWVRGLSAPGSAYTRYDIYNHLTHLVQNGWDIQYLDYMQVRGTDLPRLITLDNARLKIRLVIRSWGL